MLVIRRRPGEGIVIGDGVEIEVLESSAGRVKLGIRAPRQILVLRKEVRDTREHNRSAAREIPLELLDSVIKRLATSDYDFRLKGRKLLKTPLTSPISQL